MEKVTRRNLLEKSILGGLGLILNSCRKDKPSEEPEEVSIKVSDWHSFHKGNNFREIVYSGMPSKESFSISRPYGVFYYPVDSKEITLQNWKYEVISVDPNQITLKLK